MARNVDATKSRYLFPQGTIFVGPFENDTKLNGDGERITLALNGEGSPNMDLIDFEYSGSWLADAPGLSLRNVTSFESSLPSSNTELVSSADLSSRVNWVPTRRPTSRTSLANLIPELVMFHAAPPNGEKHDFVLLLNTGESEVSLDGTMIAGGIDAELSGVIASGERILLASDQSASLARYGQMADRVLEYSGKLSNEGDDFSLSCKDIPDPKRAWRVKYSAADWPQSIRGGGAALRPLAFCGAAARMGESSSWEPVDPATELTQTPVCPTVEIDFCAGHSIQEEWVQEFPNGTMTFRCQRRDRILAPELASIACKDGFTLDTVTQACVP